jgi:DNA modification methylase
MILENSIKNGDCFEIMPFLPAQSFDLTVTSPPYWKQRKYSDDPAEIGNEQLCDEYVDKLLACFDECLRLTKKTGNIVFNVGDKYVDQNLMLLPYKFALEARKRLDVKLINEITWVKSNPTPRQYDRRLVSSKEPFFHFVQSKDYVYNRSAITENLDKKPAGPNVGKGYFKQIENSTLTEEEKNAAYAELTEAIEEVKSGKLQSLRVKIRGIHALAFGGQGGGRNTQIVNKGYSIIRVPGNKQASDVFECAVENTKGIDHPAVYPLDLIEKVVRLTTNEGGLVFDPFMGSGTTALACKNTNRNFFGIELNPKYIEIANDRLK